MQSRNALEGGGTLIETRNLLRRHAGHYRAAIGQDANPAFGLQLAEGFPDQRPAYAEQLTHLTLDKAGPRRKLSVNDGITQISDDLVAQGGKSFHNHVVHDGHIGLPLDST